MTILMTANTAWSIYNFRAGLIQRLLDNGERVAILAPADEFSKRLEKMGCELVHLQMDNKGTNPVRDLALVLTFWREYRRLKPDIILQYTIKNVIYGSFAARLLKLPVLNMITGLGTAFNDDNWLTRIVEILYKVSQRKVRRVFFLNREDMDTFLQRQLIPGQIAERLPGEGINLSFFSPAELPQEPLRFLLIARLLWDKGVGEFVAAARFVHQTHPQVKFQLLGPVGVANRSAITLEQVRQWQAEGVIEYLGETDDVRPFIKQSQCVVLPSFYREGLPRVLMEAGAMSRPVITTDNQGCRDVVDNGLTGYLCRCKDAKDLAEKILDFIALGYADRKAMGLRSREKISREFDEQIVITRYVEAIQQYRDKPA